MRKGLLAAAVIAGLAAQPTTAALAQDSGSASEARPSQNQAQQGEIAQQDRQFAQQAAADNAAELELARLAEDKASSDEVKRYAEMLVEDHAKAGDELKRIAGELGLALDVDVPPEAQQAKEQLSQESGLAFDRAYIEQMITDHEKAVALYEDEAANGRNDALKQFASSTVDTLRTHLDEARLIEREMSEQTTAGTMDRKPGTQPQNPLKKMTASDLVGMTVVNKAGDEVGEIEDIVIGMSDRIVQAVVSVGGFLGIGDKSVAVPFDELQPGREQTVLLTSGATVEELKQRPAYDEASGDYERYPPEQTPAQGGS